MKNFVKIGLAVLGMAGLAYVVYNRAKKTHEEILDREKETTDALRKAGYSEEKIKGLVDEDEDEDDPEIGDCTINLPKELIAECSRSTVIPSEAIDTDKIFTPISGKCNGTDRVVHIRQSFERSTKRNVLSIMFQIPNSALQCRGQRSFADGSVNVSDIIKSIKGKYDRMEERMVGDDYLVFDMIDLITEEQNSGFNIKGSKPIIGTFLNGYIYLTWEKKDEDGTSHKEVRLSMIPRETYEELGYSRVSDYVYDLYKQIEGNSEGLKIECKDGNETFLADIVDAFTVLEVKILMQDKFNIDGINKKSALRILEKIYNDLEIESSDKRTRGGFFRYDYFLFYDIDDWRGVDIFYIDEDNRIRTMESIEV